MGRSALFGSSRRTRRSSGLNRQLGSGRYEVLTSEGPEARYYDREQAIRTASGLGRTAMVYDTRSDRIVWQASRSRRRFED